MNERKYYNQGWNDFILDRPFDAFATKDWQDGWREARDAPLIDQKLVEE